MNGAVRRISTFKPQTQIYSCNMQGSRQQNFQEGATEKRPKIAKNTEKSHY